MIRELVDDIKKEGKTIVKVDYISIKGVEMVEGEEEIGYNGSGFLNF